MVWKDCFGRELVVGEDVIIAITDSWSMPAMYSGVILEMNDVRCNITYNFFIDGIEVTKDRDIFDFEYEDGVIKCIYKLNI